MTEFNDVVIHWSEATDDSVPVSVDGSPIAVGLPDGFIREGNGNSVAVFAQQLHAAGKPSGALPEHVLVGDKLS